MAKKDAMVVQSVKLRPEQVAILAKAGERFGLSPMQMAREVGVLVSKLLLAELEAGAADSKPPPVRPPAPAPAPPPPSKTENLEVFAKRALAAARAAPNEKTSPERRGARLGGNVFTHAAWRAMQGEPRYTLAEFKVRLLEANQARLLTLGRADLVEAMHPADVAESEIKHLGATFNFIQLPFIDRW
jgi:hypothetical protein